MADKKIKVNSSCIGCGSCESLAPEYFDVSSGVSEVKNQYNEKDKDSIEKAKNSCPVDAIEIVEE